MIGRLRTNLAVRGKQQNSKLETGESNRQQTIQDSVELSAACFKKNRRAVSARLVNTILRNSFLGGLGAAVVTGSPLLIGAAAAIGGFTAWMQGSRQSKGSVEVELQGVKRTTEFYSHGSQFVQTHEEAEARLTAAGQLGDEIEGVQPDWSKFEARKTPAYSGQQRDLLKRLGSERRLVADLNSHSKEGHQVLNLVSATAAAKLLQADVDLYAVVDGESSDKSRELRISAINPDRSHAYSESAQYMERSYSPELRKIDSPELLDSLKVKGEGLPQGFGGLYKNEEETKLVVSRDLERSDVFISEERTSSKFKFRSESADSSISEPVRGRARLTTKKSYESSNFRSLGLVFGLITGVSVAARLLPIAATGSIIPVAIGLSLAGGLVGREVDLALAGKNPRWGG